MTSGAETPREDTLPDRILGGRFRVDHPLGRGGMATVHAGWQTAVDRPVAIKVVRADRASDPHALRALVDEARRASTVQHPHVVTILDCAHLEDGRPVIVMERLSGRSWGEWARADTPSVDRILTCARQIGAGLAAIHATGLLHGDLGPRNVFVREMAGLGPWVTLLDFGISRALGTVAGDRIWGTPGSMAPELWEGVAVDARADLWSLGVLLHLALTHRLPFPAAPDGLAAMRAGPDLAALAGRADLPPGLPDLLGALLAPHPDDRPDSATTVVQALDRLLERPAEPLTPSAEHAPGDRLPTGHVVERVLHRRGRWTEVRATRDGTFAEVCLYDTIPDDPVGALWLALARDLQPLVGRDSPPGLQSVHCAEFFGQTLCIAQPARTGERLSARLARTGPTPWRQVLRWGRQLARALGALHTSGTVHGWVHPSSVLIEDTDDQAILTGIGRRSLTALGVPALAPEVQAVTGLDRTHIDRTPASPSADWQALGETLLAALSGDLVVTSGPGARRRTAPSTVPPGVQRVLSRLATEARHIDGSDAVIAALDAVLAHPGEATTDLRRTLDATGPLLGRSPALDLLRGALEAVGDHELYVYGARNMGRLGLILGARGRWEEALEFVRSGSLGAHVLGARRGESLVLANLSALESARGRLDDAVGHAEEALAVHGPTGDHLVRAVLLRNLGLLEADRGDHGRAREHMLEALEAHAALRDDLGQARVWTDLGELALLTGAPGEAEHCYVKAQAAAEDAGDRRQIAIVTGCAAVLSHVRGEAVERAGQTMDRALDRMAEIAGPRLRGSFLAMAGAMAADRGELQRAATLLDQAEATLGALSDRTAKGTLRLCRAVHLLARARAGDEDGAVLRERAARAVRALAEDHSAHEIAIPRLLYEQARGR